MCRGLVQEHRGQHEDRQLEPRHRRRRGSETEASRLASGMVARQFVVGLMLEDSITASVQGAVALHRARFLRFTAGEADGSPARLARRGQRYEGVMMTITMRA
jgi:hypothetical protein